MIVSQSIHCYVYQADFYDTYQVQTSRHMTSRQSVEYSLLRAAWACGQPLDQALQPLKAIAGDCYTADATLLLSILSVLLRRRSPALY